MSNATTPPAGARDAVTDELIAAASIAAETLILWLGPDHPSVKRLQAATITALTGKADGGDPLTDTYIQAVPDKCDRITWRGQYYHLPIATQPAATGAAGLLGDGQCHCAKCDPPLSITSARMVLCATCGNKRCPHATDHRYACTGSNEPGQFGSAYGETNTAAPGMGDGLSPAWRAPSDTPDVEPGDDRYAIIAVRRKHNGKVYSFPAQYLNRKELLSDSPRNASGNGWSQELADEGADFEIFVTGWFCESSTPDGEYDVQFEPVLSEGDELVAWAEIPQFETSALAAQPAPPEARHERRNEN